MSLLSRAIVKTIIELSDEEDKGTYFKRKFKSLVMVVILLLIIFVVAVIVVTIIDKIPTKARKEEQARIEYIRQAYDEWGCNVPEIKAIKDEKDELSDQMNLYSDNQSSLQYKMARDKYLEKCKELETAIENYDKENEEK